MNWVLNYENQSFHKGVHSFRIRMLKPNFIGQKIHRNLCFEIQNWENQVQLTMFFNFVLFLYYKNHIHSINICFSPFLKQFWLSTYFSNWISILNTAILKISFQFCYECPTSISIPNWPLLFWWVEPNDLQNLFALLRRQIASSKPDQITLRKASFIQSYITPSAIKTQMNILLVCFWTDWTVKAAMKISAIVLKYPTFEVGFFSQKNVKFQA